MSINIHKKNICITNTNLIITLIVLCLITYYNTFDVPFIFDDFQCVKDNPLIRDFRNYFHRQRAIEVFNVNPYVLRDTLNSFFMRPVAYLTFSFNYYLHGQSVAGYHIVNLAIHTLNTIIVFLLIQCTIQQIQKSEAAPTDPSLSINDSYVAFFVAAFFGVHPLMTNSVTYITHRMTALVALFYLLSILLYAKHNHFSTFSNKVLYCFSFVCCIAAMLTKESAFTLPLMLAVYDYLFLQGAMKQRIIRLSPFILAMPIIPCNLLRLQSPQAPQASGTLESSLNIVNFTQLSSWEYLLTQFRAVGFYLKLLLMPTGLSLEHDFTVSRTLTDISVLLALALHMLLLAYGAYLIKSFKKNGKINTCNILTGFGIIWFYLCLMVESSVIPLDQVAVEYRTYLPSVGFFICFICVIEKLSTNLFGKYHYWKAGCIILLPLVCLMASLTILRNEVWRKPDTFWMQTISLYPKLGRAYINLADYYMSKGAVSDAIRIYVASIQENPLVPALHYELGRVYLVSKDYELAITELTQAILMRPTMIEAYESLAQAYVLAGRHAQANEALAAANRITYNRP